MSRTSGRDSRRYFGSHVVFGMAFGYFILHPVSMIIFRWLGEKRQLEIGEVERGAFLQPILHSFHFEMLPMGLVFGVVGGTIAAVYAWQRITIVRQRDDLAGQLALVNQYRISLEHKAEELEEKNRQLIRLERQNRRNSQFMVHDFKTHLGCILGFSELLLDRDNFSEHADSTMALRRIRRQAHQMMGAVGDLLDIARLEETGQTHRVEILVAHLFSDAVADFSLPQHTKQIQLGSMYLTCPPILGDTRLLKRVLSNLISNSLKHNGPGTRVWLDAEEAENNREVVFSCRDNGRGVAPEDGERLFDNFATGASLSSDMTGLGLAFCRAAVSSHGGRIWYQNLEDGGAVFYFTVPVKKEIE